MVISQQRLRLRKQYSQLLFEHNRDFDRGTAAPPGRISDGIFMNVSFIPVRFAAPDRPVEARPRDNPRFGAVGDRRGFKIASTGKPTSGTAKVFGIDSA